MSFGLESHQKEVISYFSWDPDPDLLDASRLSAEKAADVVEALLSESIQSVMSSDVPIGFSSQAVLILQFVQLSPEKDAR